jgi:poly(hydroxyalkanoate) depolymerase family esterase
MFKQPKRCAIVGSIVFLATVLLLPSLSVARASNGTWQQYEYNGPAGGRPYFVYTPANYRPGKAVPLLVMLHGCAQTPADFAASTQMNRLADQKQFIVVYPQQSCTYDVGECWHWYDPANQSRGSGESAIIAGITQTVAQNTAQWKIDTHRVYVSGISAGAAMAVILGATYPDIFAAIGVHSGAEYKAATSAVQIVSVMSLGGPEPAQQGQKAFNAMGSANRVVPTIVFQGMSDNLARPINGDQVIQQWMETDYLASNNTYHASFNNPSSITRGQVPGGHFYTVDRWNDDNGIEVQEYWKVYGMEHAWSGGNPSGTFTDPLGPDASRAMYNFFMRHPAGSV